MHNLYLEVPILKRQLVISVLVAVLTFGLVGTVNAERTRLSKPSKREFETRATKYLFGARFNAGSFTGEGADVIEQYSTDFADKVVYGLGMVAEYKFRPSVAIGLNLDYGWKTPVVDGMESITYYSLAGSLSYTLSPQNRSTFYGRAEFGFTHFEYENSDLGTHNYLRLGLGQVYATAPTTAARFEFYYKHHFSKGYEFTNRTGLPFGEIAFDIDWIGFEISFLFGL